jgi:mono/diheme cytochrome c family protein
VSCLLVLTSVVTAGCTQKPEDFVSNQLLRLRMERDLREDLGGRSIEVANALHFAFGTPDQPKWPEVLTESSKYHSLTDQESLIRASGPVGRNFDLVEVGLFRKQCAQCHGISGDGFGPTAALLDPYPRDFRRGTFKFKNASYGTRPSVEDLVQTITYGVPGTSMPAMVNLKRSKHYADDIPILARYVRFLAIRGEVERELMMDTVRDLDGEEVLFDANRQETNPEAFKNSLSRINEVIIRVADRWILSDGSERSQSQSPFIAFVAKHDFAKTDLVSDSKSLAENLFKESLQRGRALFEGSIAACAQCHGKDGTGDPKWKDYDEWTKDWTIRAGINPMVRAEWKPLKQLGLLKPVAAAPRNLTINAYRGTPAIDDSLIGDSLTHDLLREKASADETSLKENAPFSKHAQSSSRLAILRAVLNGIEGSPMPAAALAANTDGGLTDEQIMDLVRFVESLSSSTNSARALTGGKASGLAVLMGASQ